MAHEMLVDPGELARFGVPAPFLRQFVPEPVQIKITTGGALGTMAWQHRILGEDNYDPTVITSSPGSSYIYELTGENRWLTLYFFTSAHTQGVVYLVDRGGTVTLNGAPTSMLTATRYDLREQACIAATAEAVALMRDGVTLPLNSWGADIKRHCAALAHEFLRASVGMTADGTGQGDQNVLTWAAAARAYFADIGRSRISPPDLVDSSGSEDGPILAAYPASDDYRGW